MASVHPVSLSSSFWDRPERRDPSGLHAIRRDEVDSGSSSLDGSTTVRVDGRSGQVHVTADDGVPTEGKMNDVDELECVLLWDEEAKSYTLHRLSTSTRLNPSNTAITTASTPQRSLPLSSTRSPAFTTSKVTTTAHLSPRSDLLLRSSVSPSPRQPPPIVHTQPPTSTNSTFGLGISGNEPSSAIRPQVGRKGVLPSKQQEPNNDVEMFDNDLASASEDSDDDINFDDGLALPPSLAPVPTPGTYTYSPAPPSTTATAPSNMLSFGNNNTGVVSSDEEDDDDEDENDFDDLANDLEVSLGNPVPIPAQSQPVPVQVPAQRQATQQQPQQIARKSVPSGRTKVVDSDIASSSESDDDSGSEA